MSNQSGPTTPCIDKDDAAQVAHWAREFDVSHKQLAEAIAKVGNKATDVEIYLKGSRSSTNADTTHAAAKPQ
jgi:hypothetical protein